jgi:flagellar hook-length control protein FliK
LSAGQAAAEIKAVPLLTTKKKSSGKSGHAAGLVRVPGKGESSFSHLMMAQEGKKAAAGTAAAASESLKEALLKSLKTAAGAKQAQTADQKIALAVLTPSHQHAAGTAEIAGNGEKSDGKKKIARLPVSPAANAALSESAIEAALLIAKLGESQTGKKEESAAVQAAAVASRNQASQHAQPKILVVDLRKKAQANASESANAELKIQQTASPEKGPSLALLQRPSGHEAGGSTSLRQAPVSAPAHETPLDRLRVTAGSELLRASTMVLRDGGGEIRLVLKPESLGSVRIRMNVVDNSIDGKIIVDNSAVKQIFDGNIDALKRALTAEGFQMGSLQVSVGGQGGENARQRQEQDRPSEVRRVSARDFERNVPGVENLSMGDLMVNLFV